jgi:hypothetical protein
MAQTEIDQLVSLSLFARKQGETKKAEPCWLLPCFWTHVGAQVALQRRPILRMSTRSVPCLSFTPSQRGHLYFAKKGTSLLCIDTMLALRSDSYCIEYP